MLAQIRTILYRSIRSKSTWLLLITPALLLILAFLYRLLEYTLVEYNFAGILFDPSESVILLFFASAVFNYIMIATEKSDGGWRNKISSGVKRYNIYIASWIVSTLFTILSSALFVLAKLLIEVTWANSHKKMYSSPENNYLLLVFIWALAFTSLYTLINVYFSMKIFGLLVSLAALSGIMGIGSLCEARLEEPYKKNIVNEETGIEEYQENPYYVTGNTRKALTFVHDRVPFIRLFTLSLGLA